MASTGIIQRRDTKANLITDPPVTGELVFALDTGEHGWLDENSVLVWKKLNEASETAIIDFSKEIISYEAEYGAIDMVATFSIDNTAVPTSASNHRIFLQFEIIAGNNTGYKSERMKVGTLNLGANIHNVYSFNSLNYPGLSFDDTDPNALSFTSSLSDVSPIFDDNGNNDDVLGTFKAILTAERIYGDATNVTAYFNATANDVTYLAGGG